MRDLDLEHPAVSNAQCTGYPDSKAPDYPCCPICGEECETIYKTEGNEVQGCDCCLHPTDAWECFECFRDK